MSSQEIGKKQLEVIAYVKNYLKKCKESKVDVANSSFCYFAHWAYVPGAAVLRLKLKGISYILSFIKNILFNFLGVSTLTSYIVLRNKKKFRNFKHLVISNAQKKDFKKNGSYFDPWFQTNSRKTQNTLWFLNCVDNYFPKKIDKNLLLFVEKKQGKKMAGHMGDKWIKWSKYRFKHDFLFLFKSFIATIIKFKFSFKKILHEFSVHSQFSNIISEKILFEIANGNFKSVISPYEAQPFQNNTFAKIKEIDRKIKTIGYFHTALSPITTSMINRSGSPDKLLISGWYSKKFLNKYLGWPTKKIKTIPSFRYNTKNIPHIRPGIIYLPFNFFSLKKIVIEFENYLKMSKIDSINHMEIRNHTYADYSKKHMKLINEIKKIILQYKNRFTEKKNVKKKSIIIGATSTVILALEANIDVVHICEEPVFESYSERLWKTLLVRQISSNTFVYKLKTRQSLIKISNNSNLLTKYCD